MSWIRRRHARTACGPVVARRAEFGWVTRGGDRPAVVLPFRVPAP